MKRKLLILGSTGSIGRQAVGLLEGSEDLEVVGLSAASDGAGLEEQASALGVDLVALADRGEADRLNRSFGGEVL